MLTGLDIGGTSIKGVLVDSRFRILKKVQLPTLADQDKSSTLKNIVSAIKELGRSDAIGISIAGRVDKRGFMSFNPNIPGLNGVKIAGEIKKRTGMPITVENDASCFAIAEHRIGSGKGSENMIGLTIGTGIGSGLIINGNLYKGNGNAGELGHSVIDPSGPICGCGKKGDLESWCSGRSITSRYLNAYGAIKDPDPIKIFYAKEKTAQRIIDETIEKLAIGITNMIAEFDPDTIVIGGGVSNLPIFGRLRRAIKKFALKDLEIKTKIKKSGLMMPGSVGAAMVASQGLTHNRPLPLRRMDRQDQ
ncbi:ROK family protein [Candidatus Woesearchaeota archaeon]|nr:ROK family protein [Candidatus Woesearchaeota archaeon]